VFGEHTFMVREIKWSIFGNFRNKKVLFSRVVEDEIICMLDVNRKFDNKIKLTLQ